MTVPLHTIAKPPGHNRVAINLPNRLMKSLVAITLSLWWTPANGLAQKVPSRLDITATNWGSIVVDANTGWASLVIAAPASKITLPTPMPNVTSAFVGTPDWPADFLPFSFNEDATEMTLHLAEKAANPATDARDESTVTLQIAEQSQQFPSGRIVFSALDAEVLGDTAKLETHPGNHRIGFWSNAADCVQWIYAATRPGKYEVQLTYSLAGESDSDGSDIQVTIGDTKLTHTLVTTGSWYRYTTVNLGTAYLATPTEHTVSVKCVNKRGSAVMNLKAITLVPTCEGTPPVQANDGTILLHASDVTANGILLQWEPKPIKRTLGYWANPHDYAFWDFTVTQGGAFDTQILQGCGEGHGGSEAKFSFFETSGSKPVAELKHIVKDTGHWQAFEPIELGTVTLAAGKYRLRVDAITKAKGAVMDLQQVLLTPTE